MILLRKARIFDKRSPHHLKKMDILIEQGKITEIAKSIKPTKTPKKIIESKSLCVSPGWLDIGTFNGEPGFEYREDLNSLRDAALRGGYVALAPFPMGAPTVDNKGQLQFLKSRNVEHAVQILPIAALTKSRQGKEMAEYIDLHEAGAVAFSDGTNHHLSMDELGRAMLYLKSFGGKAIWSAAKDDGGHVHQGDVSVKMGLPGTPAFAEEDRIQSAISQSEYVNAPLVIHGISTIGGLKAAKSSPNKNEIQFTVPALNLIHTDQEVVEFDHHLKVLPPLRDVVTQRTLTKAVASQRIQAIVSNHTPLSLEEKDQPFGMSQSGVATIETVFAALNTWSKVDLEDVIHALSIGPYDVLGLDGPRIEKDQNATITIFDNQEEWTYDRPLTQGKNPIYIDKTLKGKPLGIISQGRYHAS